MSAHTPGPWRESWDYHRTSPDSMRVVAFACGPQIMSDGVSRDLGGVLLQPSREACEQVQADARLIAAAPDLLAALKTLIDDAAVLNEALIEKRVQGIAAIMKAEGR